MNLNCRISIMALIAISTCSCKKLDLKGAPLSSLKIINTVTNGPAVRLGNNATIIIDNNSYSDFTVIPGNPDIYIWPITDSSKPYYNSVKNVTMNNGEIYTLFLGGDTNNVASQLVKENLPYRADSTAGIRFINLSPGSPNVKVKIAATGEVAFDNVAYQQLTEFKSYPATSANTSYRFQVFNANTDELITSINMSGSSLSSFVPRFRNVTLVLRGIVGGSPNAGITRVNHYQ